MYNSSHLRLTNNSSSRESMLIFRQPILKLAKESENSTLTTAGGRVYNSSGDILPTERVDYGAKFIYEADALIRRNKNDQVTVRKVREVYGRCHSLLVEAAEQVKKCLPPSKDIFNGLSYLHPSRILSRTARVPLASLPMQHLINEKVQEIDNKYRVSYTSIGKKVEF